MSDTDRYADIYLNFQDRQQWLADSFQSMTHKEYMCFEEYVFKELDFAAEAGDGAEFRRVKGLLLALARKNLEVAHFMRGITDEQRAAALRAATASYELAKGFYGPEVVPKVEAAWTAHLNRAATFGWPSVVFDLLPPSRVFKDPDEEPLHDR